MYELPATHPSKPGLVRTRDNGMSLEVEIWELSLAEFGAFVSRIPQPLTIGTIDLADGTSEQGFLCEGSRVEGCRDITEYGSWRAFLQAREQHGDSSPARVPESAKE